MSIVDVSKIVIPKEFLPKDGRFGSGPSLIRPEQIDRIIEGALTMGTSHRQKPVKTIVERIRCQLAQLYNLPDGYEVVLGNGGASAFWDIAICSLVTESISFGVFGEFGNSFANATTGAPHIKSAFKNQAVYGSACYPSDDLADVYAYPHNETSTGAMIEPKRINTSSYPNALTVVDGTSAAGGLKLCPSEVDVYYFSPQKCFASDGGIWFAFLSPKAIDRIEKIDSLKEGDKNFRWIPSFLSLKTALENSRNNQTLNTPAIATLLMMDEQVNWLLECGGIDFSNNRCRKSSSKLYNWAEKTCHIEPFVEKQYRSEVIVTLDLDEKIDADTINQILRLNGIYDTFSYRKLNRNQLRIATFPQRDYEDIEQLTYCLEFLISQF